MDSVGRGVLAPVFEARRSGQPGRSMDAEGSQGSPSFPAGTLVCAGFRMGGDLVLCLCLQVALASLTSR